MCEPLGGCGSLGEVGPLGLGECEPLGGCGSLGECGP